MPSEVGYVELVRFFDYLRSIGQVGPAVAKGAEPHGTNGTNGVNGVNGTNGVKHSNGANGVNGTNANGHKGDGDDHVEICVIDADDMLDDPEATIKAYCASVGLEYKPEMLKWDSAEEQQIAQDLFEKWPGWHDDALDSTCLKKREHVRIFLSLCGSPFHVMDSEGKLLTCTKKKKPKSDDELFEEWKGKFGEEAAREIRKIVEENVPYYEYLKQHAIKV